MFWLWRKLDDADRCRVWKYYGWFSGLMCIGCLTGAVSYAGWAVFLVNYYDSKSNSKSYAAVRAARTAAACCIAFMPRFQALRGLSVYAVTYPFTLCCVAITKLLVLDRMMDFSKLKDANSSRWTFFGRALVGFVVVGNVVGFAAVLAACVFWSNAEAMLISDEKESWPKGVLGVMLQGAKAAAVYIFIESIMLLLIVIAFGVVGAACVRRIRVAMQSFRSTLLVPIRDTRNSITQSGDALASGLRLNRQITSTCCVVFLSFFIRAAYTTIFALSAFLQTIPNNPENRCPSNNNFFSFLFIWLLYNPILFFSLILVSQPVALLVSLWGMTSGQMISLIRHN